MSIESLAQPQGPGRDDVVIIGAIDRAFGVQGVLCVTSLSDVPGRFAVGLPVELVGPRGTRLATQVTSVRPHGTRLLVGVADLTAPEAVAPFRGGYLYARREPARLPAGQYFQCDLLGLSVQNDTGLALGHVHQVLESGTEHVFVVREGARELLIPASKAWVLDVDLTRRVMTVRVPEFAGESEDVVAKVRHAV